MRLRPTPTRTSTSEIKASNQQIVSIWGVENQAHSRSPNPRPSYPLTFALPIVLVYYVVGL